MNITRVVVVVTAIIVFLTLGTHIIINMSPDEQQESSFIEPEVPEQEEPEIESTIIKKVSDTPGRYLVTHYTEDYDFYIHYDFYAAGFYGEETVQEVMDANGKALTESYAVFKDASVFSMMIIQEMGDGTVVISAISNRDTQPEHYHVTKAEAVEAFRGSEISTYPNIKPLDTETQVQPTKPTEGTELSSNLKAMEGKFRDTTGNLNVQILAGVAVIGIYDEVYISSLTDFGTDSSGTHLAFALEGDFSVGFGVLGDSMVMTANGDTFYLYRIE